MRGQAPLVIAREELMLDSLPAQEVRVGLQQVRDDG
jgi:hypothetical protein